MTLDAMDWVWRHSRTRNAARFVLLALADACTDDTATARMGTAEMMRRANASKGAIIEAVPRAVALGELEIVEPGSGSRAALYRLPGAVGYSRVSGRETGPQTQRSGNPTGSVLRSGNPTTTAPDSGRETRPEPQTPEQPLRSGNPTGSGRETEPHHAPIEGVSEGGKDSAPAPTEVPDFARPVTDAIGRAGHTSIRWSLTPAEWLIVHALIKRSGADALARFAIDQADRRRVAHGRYFLPGWKELAPAPGPATEPTPGANVVPFNAVGRRPSKVQAAAAMFAAAAGLNPQEGSTP